MATKDDRDALIAQIHEALREHDMPAYPIAAKDAGVVYTDYLTGAHKKGPFNYIADNSTEDYVYTPNRNRQCSIGYHEECSDPEGETCGCVCHVIVKAVDEYLGKL